MTTNSTTKQTGEPEACPFHKPEINRSEVVGEWHSGQRIAYWSVFCEACGAHGPEEDTHEEAIQAWNSRAAVATPPDIDARLDRAYIAGAKFGRNAGEADYQQAIRDARQCARATMLGAECPCACSCHDSIATPVAALEGEQEQNPVDKESY